MSNLVKKIISACAGLAIVFSVVSPIAGISAAYNSLEAANKLATLGVIVDQSGNPSDYRLGDTISRREMAKVTLNLSSSTVTDSCIGKFSDLPSSDWGCKYAESGLSQGYFASNDTFRPDANISKWEALKFVMKSRGVEKGDDSDFRKGYVDAAVSAGITSTFSDYDTSATRGQIFVWAAEAVSLQDDAGNEEESNDEDFLSDLLGDLDDEEDESVDEDESDEEENGGNDDIAVEPISDSNTLTVSLSPETPSATTVAGGVNGLPVAKFDFIAGNEDVNVSQITIRRRGLSDRNTLDSLAIFSEQGRISNENDDNQEDDQEAQLNLNDGGYVVKAGETETLTVVVDVGLSAVAESDEFAIEIIGIVAQSSTEINEEGSLVSNSFRVGSVDAPTLTFRPRSTVSDPTLGEIAADIFEFEIRGADDEDVILKAVTFEGTSDAEDDLANFQLLFGNKVVAETTRMIDDYLTFVLDDGGLRIEEDKTEDFTVKADIVEGANDTIAFSIDERLDVTAESTKFGNGARIDISDIQTPATTSNPNSSLGLVTIEAGELTILEIEAELDEIREDKENINLGQIKITNVAGKSLELQELGIRVEIATTGTQSFVDDGTDGGTGGDNVRNGGEVFLTPQNIFEDFEIYNEDTGVSYELTVSSNSNRFGQVDSTTLFAVYEEDNIDVLLPQGTTIWTIRADTIDEIGLFDNSRITLSFVTTTTPGITSNGGFYVEETDDDEPVTDITPSSVTFNAVDGSESGADVSIVPLSQIDVVRGARDVVALQFEVEADESSAITVDQLVAQVLRSRSQVNTAVVTGTSTGVVFVTAVAGTTISVTGVTSTSDTATAIATAINANSTTSSVVSATSNGSNVVVTANNPGNVFSFVTSENGANATYVSTTTTANQNGTVAFNSAGGTDGGTVTPNSSISEAILYRGTVSRSNILDQESGSNITNNGTITFDDFDDVPIGANKTETFIITLSVVDADSAPMNGNLNVRLLSINIDDDENDDVDATVGGQPIASDGNLTISARNITVNGAGRIITLNFDLSNVDNEFDKISLAGRSAVIASYDVRADNEAIDIEVVTFTLTGATQLRNSLSNASLLLGGQLIATNQSNDIIQGNGTTATITFDDLATLIIPETTTELALQLNSTNIGENFVGIVQTGLAITNVVFSEADGVDSGRDLSISDIATLTPSNTNSKLLDIVPAIVTPSVIGLYATNDQVAEIRLTVDGGENTAPDGDAVRAELVQLNVEVSSLTSTGVIEVFNGNGQSIGSADATANGIVTVTIDNNTSTSGNQADAIGNDSETYRVQTTGEAIYRLARNGVVYNINGDNSEISTRLQNTLELGQYTRSQ